MYANNLLIFYFLETRDAGSIVVEGDIEAHIKGGSSVKKILLLRSQVNAVFLIVFFTFFWGEEIQIIHPENHSKKSERYCF